MTIRRRTLLGAALAVPALQMAHAAPGNVLRIAIGTSPNTLDPMLTTIGDEYIYDCLVFSGLTRIREDLKLEPDLAESWSISPGHQDVDLQAAARRQIPQRRRAGGRRRGGRSSAA